MPGHTTARRGLLRRLGPPRPEPAGSTLVCLPYAGKGPSLFHRWPVELGSAADLYALALPGREERIAEPPYTDPDALIEELCEACAPHLDRPLYLFGHSMGALLAARLALALRERTGSTASRPAALILSGSIPWWLPSDTLGGLGDLPDDEFLARIDSWGGIPRELFAFPDLLELALPVLRSDARLIETLRGAPAPAAPALDCPLVLFSGARDEHATAAQMLAWRALTTGPVTARVFEGDHFFLHGDEGVYAAVRSVLGSAGAPGEAARHAGAAA